GPCLLEPGWAPCGGEMLRHQAGLVKRPPHVVQHRPPLLAGGEHAKLPPAQPPDEPGGPTGRLTAHATWTCVAQLPQAWLLLGGQLWGATATLAVDQAVAPPPQPGLLPAIEASGAETPALTHHHHGHVGPQEVAHDVGR